MIYWRSRTSQIWLAIVMIASSLFQAYVEENWMAGARQFVVFVLVIAGIELMLNLIILFFPPPEPKEKK